jgi:transposase InsO family protein
MMHLMVCVGRRANAIVRLRLRPNGALIGYLADLARTREELLAENALLRQQLIVLQRQSKKPKLGALDRIILLICARLTRTWQSATLIVKPATVLRWHRQGFRLFWRHKSRRPSQRGPRLQQETIELIRNMARNDRLWGAERIRGELLKLGIRVSKRTIQKYMRGVRATPSPGQSWKTFLQNHLHETWAVDFLQLYDIWFRPIFAFFILELGTRRVVGVGVTRSPTWTWTALQLRNVTAWGTGPRFIIRDRDDKFGPDFDRAVKAVAARVIKTAVRTPNMNAYCERFLRSVREGCLDHVLILDERHLLRTLNEYVDYHNGARPHQGIDQRVPDGARYEDWTAPISALPVLGGLHHDYRRAA